MPLTVAVTDWTINRTPVLLGHSNLCTAVHNQDGRSVMKYEWINQCIETGTSPVIIGVTQLMAFVQ